MWEKGLRYVESCVFGKIYMFSVMLYVILPIYNKKLLNDIAALYCNKFAVLWWKVTSCHFNEQHLYVVQIHGTFFPTHSIYVNDFFTEEKIFYCWLTGWDWCQSPQACCHTTLIYPRNPDYTSIVFHCFQIHWYQCFFPIPLYTWFGFVSIWD